MSFADEQDKNPKVCGPGDKHMRASVRHIEGKGIGYNQGYTTLERVLKKGHKYRWYVVPENSQQIFAESASAFIFE